MYVTARTSPASTISPASASTALSMFILQPPFSMNAAVRVNAETLHDPAVIEKLAEADFLSIGTNYLTQYTLAMDRTRPQLAAQADAFHPAGLCCTRSLAEQVIEKPERARHAYTLVQPVIDGLGFAPRPNEPPGFELCEVLGQR